MTTPFDREPWYRYFPDQNPPPPAEKEEPRYIPSEAIVRAVNTALVVGQPLLVMGEPGVGKSTLARSIASVLGLGDVEMFVTRSDSQPQDVLYHVDHLGRMYDAQAGDVKAKVLGNYVKLRPLGKALKAEGQMVVLIDEVDKASRDFSDGLLHELDQMDFEIRETGERVKRPKGSRPPFVLITSNEERDLSDAFLRRCVFLRIPFPDDGALTRILGQHVSRPPDDPVVGGTVGRFKRAREVLRGGLKKPSVGELVSWGRMLAEAKLDAPRISALPWARLFPELLAKNNADYDVLLRADAR